MVVIAVTVKASVQPMGSSDRDTDCHDGANGDAYDSDVVGGLICVVARRDGGDCGCGCGARRGQEG